MSGTQLTTLSDEERERVTDALGWHAWPTEHPVFTVVESILTARVRQAELDANSAVKRADDQRVRDAKATALLLLADHWEKVEYPSASCAIQLRAVLDRADAVGASDE